jgi:hypothetical protein
MRHSRVTDISGTGAEIPGNSSHAARILAACMVLLLMVIICLMAGTIANYVNDTGSSQDAGIADYGMSIDIPETAADVVQNETCDYGRIISLDNRSQTALAYDIVISLDGAKTWPEGLTAVLVTGDGEKTDGVVSGNVCRFKDQTWQLKPGESVQDMYGLRLGTTYDTDPGNYRFSISSVTYQIN